MKYYLIAGEASGDLHGSNLMKQIKASDSKAEFRFWGGDLMQEQDKNLLVHYRETAFMGLSDVLLNLNTIRKFLKKCKADILHFNPDALIFIDYPGFNLRIAKFAKENKFKTHYYIHHTAFRNRVLCQIQYEGRLCRKSIMRFNL